MSQKCKDETRWLARAVAVYVLIFTLKGFVKNLSAAFDSLRGDSSGLIYAVIGLILGAVFFWLGVLLLVCSSLWNCLSFLEKYAAYMFVQCEYFGINKHIRSGLTGSAVMLLVVYPIPLMSRVFKDTIIAEFTGFVFTMVLWPLRTMFNAFDAAPQRAIIFLIVLLYLIITGFILGAGISYLAGGTTYKEVVD